MRAQPRDASSTSRSIHVSTLNHHLACKQSSWQVKSATAAQRRQGRCRQQHEISLPPLNRRNRHPACSTSALVLRVRVASNLLACHGGSCPCLCVLQKQYWLKRVLHRQGYHPGKGIVWSVPLARNHSGGFPTCSFRFGDTAESGARSYLWSSDRRSGEDTVAVLDPVGSRSSALLRYALKIPGHHHHHHHHHNLK
jgi:hypothetical protein